MRQSMTGFASAQGAGLGLQWTWEMRGVNAKGLDLRLRMPDWVEGLEAKVRAALGKALTRGNIQVSLRLASDGDEGALRLDPAQLDRVLDAMTLIESQAMERGLSLAPSTAADIVSLRGVMTTETGDVDHEALRTALMADFAAALEAFVAMRRSEGAAMAEILSRQLDEITTLVGAAAAAAAARAEDQEARLKAQLARVLDTADSVEPARVAQELALIAVKSDVTEELDRLRAHVAAVRDLLATKGPIGRKLDFLCQEFNREANTLCAKSGDAALTQVGLDLKTTIDQMREQVQNVE